MDRDCESCSEELCMDGKAEITVSGCSLWTAKPIINGVANDEIVSNEQGGKQSKLEFRFDLIDTKAIFALANVLHTGEVRYGKDNWKKIDVDSHLNHALSHIYAYLAGDRQDEHLSHGFCRLMMAIGVGE